MTDYMTPEARAKLDRIESWHDERERLRTRIAELEAENENLTALYEGAKVAAREWRVERDEYRSRMLASEHLVGSLVAERDSLRACVARGTTE